MPAVTRRAFLKLTALLASAAVALRVHVVGAAQALPPGCEPQTATAIPMSIPTAIGRECRYTTYLPRVGG